MGAKQFQINGAARLCEIFENRTRAFLADEAGLGKTYTAAITAGTLARRKWAKQGEGNETPFRVLYVAPSTAVLEKCCADFCDKYAETYHGEGQIINLWVKSVDRLAFAYKEITAKRDRRSVILLPTSIHLLGERTAVKMDEFDELLALMKSGPVRRGAQLFPEKQAYEGLALKEADDIWDYLAGLGLLDDTVNRWRLAVEKTLLASFDLVIFDEYHRYIGSLLKAPPARFAAGSVYDCEEQNGLKLLFVSATPYQSGGRKEERDPGSEEVYAEEEYNKVSALPTLEQFEPLFYGGVSKESAEAEKRLSVLDKAYKDKMNAYLRDLESAEKKKEAEDARDRLWKLLSSRVVRHERTLLSGFDTPEPHARLFRETEDQNRIGACENQIKNTYLQKQRLRAAGYEQAMAQNWSKTVPWLMSFSTNCGRNTRDAAGEDGDEKKNCGYFEVLKPEASRNLPLSGELFAYKRGGMGAQPEERVKSLPEQNVSFQQICGANLTEELLQMVWIPPTIRGYRAPEGSIFARNANASKLLVFAEYRCMQRGGSLLLSDYALAKNAENLPRGWEEMELKLSCPRAPEELSKLYPGEGFAGRCALEDLTGRLAGREPGRKEARKKALAILAAPSVCAAGLGLDVKKTEEAFYTYFNKQPVKAALLRWMREHGYDIEDAEERELGLLQYCAEGDLRSVLSEWKSLYRKTVRKGKEIDFSQMLSEVLALEPSQIHVQTADTYLKENPSGLARSCGFAERLTADRNDVGSSTQGDDNKAVCNAFNSPFYPMVVFGGRGFQEGLDFHIYCLRIMHMTLPRGAVSFDQRQGRIDRYRSLLVRRRAAEVFRKEPDAKGNWQRMECGELLEHIFDVLQKRQRSGELCDAWTRDQLFPDWQIRERYTGESEHHFERIVAVLPHTDEELEYQSCKQQLKSYRSTLGSAQFGREIPRELTVDLTAPPMRKIPGAILLAPRPIHPEENEAAWKPLEEAYRAAAAQAAKWKPDTIVLVSSCIGQKGDRFRILSGNGASGSVAFPGAAQEPLKVEYDIPLCGEIVRLARLNGLCFDEKAEGDPVLDRDSILALHFLREAGVNCPIVRLGVSDAFPLGHCFLGRCIAYAANMLMRRVVLVACEELPVENIAGRDVEQALVKGDLLSVLNMEPERRKEASEGGLRALQVMAGVLNCRRFEPKLFRVSSEADGNFAAAAFPVAAGADETHAFYTQHREAVRARRPGESEDPFVWLARQALETWMKTGKELTRQALETRVQAEKDGKLRDGLQKVLEQKEQAWRVCVSCYLQGQLWGRSRVDIECADGQIKWKKKTSVITNLLGKSAATICPSVWRGDLDSLEYIVDVLSAPEPVGGPDQLDAKRYGVIVSSGARQGLALPGLDVADTVEKQVETACKLGKLDPESRTTLNLFRFAVDRHC